MKYLVLSLIIACLLGIFFVFASLENEYIVEIAEAQEYVVAEVTMYNAVPEQTDSDYLTTASGLKIREGMAACPIWLEFGTRIEIEGKEYYCQDRMNARYRTGNYFDILAETEEEARNWGRKTLEVIIK